MNNVIFTQSQGILMIFGFAILISFLTCFFSRKFSKTKTQFLVAERELNKTEASFSIAANWIWAPALFLASEKAYTQGIIGLFWFIVPNILCLVLFAFFATKLRNKFPNGFTLSEYMKSRYSKRVQIMYMIELIGLATCSFAVQLLAGGTVLSLLTGINFFYITLILAIIPIGYSVFSGIKASVVSDFIQMTIILIVCFSIIPFVTIENGGIETIKKGLGGISGNYTNIFSSEGWKIFLIFGLPVTIGLMSGPFGDQSFWQRTFSIKEKYVKQSFIQGALIFGIVPLLLSVLGFIAAGKGWQIKNTQLVNIDVVLKSLPFWTVIPFTYMLLSGLVSTLDSNLCAISSIVGHDMVKKEQKNENIFKWARISMLILAIGGILIANIPGIKILYLFMFYGTLRASTLLPTIITILKEKVSESGIFWGIVTSLTFGLPIFAYGNYYKITSLIIFGSLFTVLSSGIITVITTRFTTKIKKY